MLLLCLQSCSLDDMKRKECVNCWWISLMNSYWCTHHLDRVQWVLCLISMTHSMTLFLCLLCRCLLIWIGMKRSDLFIDVFVSSFFCIHNSDRVSWVWCLISMLHSMTLLLCLQYCSLLMWREREKSKLLMDVFGVHSFVFTIQIEFSECCVWFQWFTQWWCSSFSNLVVWWCEEK